LTVRAFIRAHNDAKQAQQLNLLARIQRSDQPRSHRVCGRDQLLKRPVALGRQPDRLAPAIPRVAFAADEPACSEPGDDLSHRGAVQRDPLAQRALVDVRLAMKRVERSELR
jgi:hypothetical protein